MKNNQTEQILNLIKEALAFKNFYSKGLDEVNTHKLYLWIKERKKELNHKKEDSYILTMKDCKELFHFFNLDIKDFDHLFMDWEKNYMDFLNENKS